MTPQRKTILLATAALCLAATAVGAQNGSDTPAITADEIRPGVFALIGGGGANSTLLATDSGGLLIDSKIDENGGAALLSIVTGVSTAPLRYLVNSHVHPDHTGGNAVFGRNGVLIVGHEEVQSILAAGQRGGPPAPAAALPVLTFSNGEGLRIRLGGEIADIRHVPAAHTTDNSVIHLVNANVWHLGDLYGPARYPVLAGGTLQGFIDGVSLVLEAADDDALFVPGVGPVTGRAELTYFLEMLTTVERRVRELIAAGKSLDEIVAARPTAEFDATFGAPDHPRFLPIVYEQLAAAN